MKNIILILLFCFSFTYGQNNFFKYSTFYTSMSMGSSMVEDQDYRSINKGYEDITEINPYDYNVTIGLRKIARFDYEYKVKTWYYGTEDNIADNVTIGNAIGWEYLFNYSFIRNRGDAYNEQNFWLRYLGNRFVTKIQYTDNQRIDLKYISTDLRYRINKGNWDITFGFVGRIHPVYGVTPIEDFWVQGESSFQQLASDFGYSSELVNGRWHWFNGDELIATSNDEFFKHYFGSAVAEYNQQELEKLGLQKELSAVLGLAYYKYANNLWLHTWVNLMPYHIGLDDYSFDYEDSLLEWDAGIVFGARVTKNLGIFVEGTHMKYWDKPIFDLKFGFNYLIF